MEIDTDLITAQEFEWIVNNEPTFQVQGNSFIGKVGRAPNGEDIRIKIDLPDQFYPVVKPKIKVISNINHPNIDPDGTLSLQILDEWEPRYRLRDIILATRRLFAKSKNAIQIPKSSKKTGILENNQIKNLRSEIQDIQKKISSYSQKINQLKAEKLQDAGVSNQLSGAIPISEEAELKATDLAITDLLNLIEFKFEDTEMDEISFFRLYRKYTREQYIIKNKLAQKGGIDNVIPKQKTKKPVRN